MVYSRDPPRLLLCVLGLHLEQNYIGFITVAICGEYISKTLDDKICSHLVYLQSFVIVSSIHGYI